MIDLLLDRLAQLLAATGEAGSGRDEVTLADARLVAVLCSVPPVVTWAALRCARQAATPPGGLRAEADVRREFAISASASYLELDSTFRAEARELLRRAVRETMPDGVVDDEVRTLLTGPALNSPLLSLETDLVLAYVTDPNFLDVADHAFTNCIRTIGREGREGILDWAAGALRRLPPAVLECPAGWLLAQMCHTRLPTFELTTEPEGMDAGLVRDAAPYLPRFMLGFNRTSDGLGIGTITAQRRLAISAPRLGSYLGTLSWQDGDGAHTHDLRFDPSQAVVVPTGRREVVITDLAGDQYALAAYDGDTPPEEIEIERRLDHAEAAWKQQQALPARIVRTVSSKGYIVQFHENELFAFLPQARTLTSRDKLSNEGLILTLRITNFDRTRQRVICEELHGLRLEVNGLWVGPLKGRFVMSRFRAAFVWIDGSVNGLPWGGSAAELVGGDENVAATLQPDQSIDVALRMASNGLLATTETSVIQNADISIGAVFHGVVETVVNFGAFVRFGSLHTGLVHTSEYGPWTPQIGSEAAVRIISIGPRGRIGLTIDATDTSKNWITHYREGDRHTGIVSRIVPFGVFVTLGPAEALLHRSEIPATAQIAIGDQVEVELLSIDRTRFRISLALIPRKSPDTPQWSWAPYAHTNPDPRSVSLSTPSASTVESAQTMSRKEAEYLLHRILVPSNLPILMATLGERLRNAAAPKLAPARWYGYKNFQDFVTAVLPKWAMLGRDESGTLVVSVYGSTAPALADDDFLPAAERVLPEGDRNDMELARRVLAELVAPGRLPIPLTDLAVRFQSKYRHAAQARVPRGWFGYRRMSKFLEDNLPEWAAIEGLDLPTARVVKRRTNM